MSLPQGMKHTKEEDALLTRDALKRAYAKPGSLPVMSTKKVRPTWVPEDIDKYRWVIQGKTIRKVIKWTLIVIVLYFVWLWSSEGFVWFQNQKQRFNGGLLPCQNELLGYLCARKELNN